MKRLWNSPLATTWAATGAQLGSLIILLPLVLGKFPAEEVRFWLTLNSLLILNLLVEVGFSTTFGRLYSYAMAGKGENELGIQGEKKQEDKSAPNWKTVQLLNGAGQRIFLILATAYFVVLGVLGTLIVSDVVDGLSNPTGGWIVWGVMVIAQPLNFLGKKYGCYLSGTGLIAINQRFTALISLLSTVVMVSALLLGAGIFFVIFVGQMTALASLIRLRFLAVRARKGRYQDSLFGKSSQEVWQVAWPSAWKSAIGHVSLTGATHLSIIIFSKGVDPVEGAAYLLTLRLISTLSQISNAPLYSKLPFLGRLRGQGDLEAFIALAKKGMSFSMNVFVLGVLGLALVGPQLFDLFKKEVGFPPLNLWLGVGTAIAFQRFGAMHLQLYTTTNHVVWHWVGGVTAIPLIAILLIGIPLIGGMAFPLALMVAYGLVYAPWSAVLSYRSLKTKLWEFEKTVSLPSLILLTIGLVIFYE